MVLNVEVLGPLRPLRPRGLVPSRYRRMRRRRRPKKARKQETEVGLGGGAVAAMLTLLTPAGVLGTLRPHKHLISSTNLQSVSYLSLSFFFLSRLRI